MTDAREKLRSVRVYAVLTERLCRMPWRETAEALLAGGVDALQLREKELPAGELLRRARVLRRLTADADTLLIVNDRPDVAILCGADGVHVGQEDLPVVEVRRLVGPEMLLGLSVDSVEEAKAVVREPVDYLGVGPAYPTSSKEVAFGRGIDAIRDVCAAVDLPVVAIGGITPDNAEEAIAAGATGVASISALCSAPDPAAAARAMRRAVDRAAPTELP